MSTPPFTRLFSCKAVEVRFVLDDDWLRALPVQGSNNDVSLPPPVSCGGETFVRDVEASGLHRHATSSSESLQARGNGNDATAYQAYQYPATLFHPFYGYPVQPATPNASRFVAERNGDRIGQLFLSCT